MYFLTGLSRLYQRPLFINRVAVFGSPPSFLDPFRDRSQKRIIVCMDFVKGRCTRESCRYFHPPAHLRGKPKTVKISKGQLSLISGLVFTAQIILLV